jgi:hypothetical protein
MSEPLVTYLNDHLAGAQMAIQLLESMHNQNDDQEFRQFASVLLPEIQADDQTLRHIAEKIGSGPSGIKQVGGWLVEKAARLKLGHTGSKSFELFQSMELLALGIQGKLSLWKALRTALGQDARLRGYDFDSLIVRAQEQYDKAEGQRLKLAQTVLSPTAVG